MKGYLNLREMGRYQPTLFQSWLVGLALLASTRIIAIHAAVGTGAGLLIGLVLSSASKDESSVILTWTALGAVAGLVSGVVTCLVGRRE